MRIVSLLPSSTEIVFALGLGDELVGVTHACDWPPEAADIPTVTRPARDLGNLSSRDIDRLVGEAVHGGSALYELDEAALEAAQPDLILTQEPCAVCAVSFRQVNEVARAIDAEITVVALGPTSIEGIFNSIATVGAMSNAEEAALDVVADLRQRLRDLEARIARRREAGQPAVRVVALEWLDPPFVVGHWVPEQIRRSGGWDLLGREGDKAVASTWQAIHEVDPEMLILMPCGFHLAETVAQWERTPKPPFWQELEAVRRGQVFAVDGSAYFSRPGPRVIDGMELLAEVFDPDGFVETSPLGSWTPLV
jgi:iron complex transport system substrate-binding protein